MFQLDEKVMKSINRAIIASVSIMVIMGLFPPCITTYSCDADTLVGSGFSCGGGKPLGYIFLFTSQHAIEINRLIVQYIVVILVTGLYIYLKLHKHNR